jgi:hypothetical protein
LAGTKACRQCISGMRIMINQKIYPANFIQEFVAAPALAPPEATVDAALLEQYQKEMHDAAQMPLPDEDDADL